MITPSTVGQLKQWLHIQLALLYLSAEIDFLHRHLASHCFGIDFSRVPVSDDRAVDTMQVETYLSFADKLEAGQPLQYVLGYTEFYDCHIAVRPGVLIPRPETEELVHHIVQTAGSAPSRILDIGTGSGCIAVALAKSCHQAQVSAYDISPEALAVANENATKNGVKIDFAQVDILQWEMSVAADCQWDIIVSNPPYILEEERPLMHRNVLEHEPELALFVPDEDPLRFYIAIAQYAAHSLCNAGQLYFEINERFADQTEAMLKGEGFTNIHIFKDMQGKDRWMSCQYFKATNVKTL